MKVLIVHPGPHFSVADVYNGLAKGLRQNGCDVGILNLDDRIEFYARAVVEKDDGSIDKALSMQAAMEMASNGIDLMCYRWWPDVVIIVSGFYVQPLTWATLKRRPHHTVYFCTESPYEDDRQGVPAQYADTVILNDPTNLEQFRKDLNKNTHYFPHSYDPDLHYPGPGRDDMRSEFAFVGTGFPSRVDFFEQVNWSGIDAKFGGNWRELRDDSPLLPLLFRDRAHCMDNDITAEVYRSSKISANVYRKEHSEDAHAQGWAMGPREVELAACETFFLREARGEGDALFPGLPIFDGPGEFEEQLRWWLAHDKEREKIARQVRSVISDWTFQNTARRLLRVIEHAGTKVAA